MSSVNSVNSTPFVPDVVKTVAQQQDEERAYAATSTAAAASDSASKTAAATESSETSEKSADVLSRSAISSILRYSTASDVMSALGLSGTTSSESSFSTLANAASLYRKGANLNQLSDLVSGEEADTSASAAAAYAAPVVKTTLSATDSAALTRAQDLIKKGTTIDMSA